MAYSLTGFTAGSLNGIETEDMNREANLFVQALPKQDYGVVLNLFGLSITITLSGVFVVGMGGLTCAQFVTELDDSCVGSTETKRTFVSDVAGTITNLQIDSVRWNYKAGEPSMINYDIVLLKGN